MAKIHKSGQVTGKVSVLPGAMAAKIFDGINMLACYPQEIIMTVSSRLAEQRQHFGDASKIFKKYSLKRKMVWAIAAGMLGTAYLQLKRMSTRTVGAVIRRSRGVLMGASAYFCQCYCLRKTAGFSSEFDGELDPPLGVSPPNPPHLIDCFYDDQLDGLVLDLEEPPLLTYESTFAHIEEQRQRIIKEIIPRSDIYAPKAIEMAQESLGQLEGRLKKMQADGIKPESVRFLERKVIIESAFSHVIASEGIITLKLDVPFTRPLANADGTPKLGSLWGKPVIRVVFPALPTTLRKIFKSGWVRVKDLTDAVARFEGETIVAWDKSTGAIASATSAILGAQTPTQTHPEALAIYRKLSDFNARQKAKRRMTKVVSHKLSANDESDPMPEPIIIRSAESRERKPDRRGEKES